MAEAPEQAARGRGTGDGRRLAGHAPPARQQHGVGERAADVDPEDHGRKLSGTRRGGREAAPSLTRGLPAPLPTELRLAGAKLWSFYAATTSKSSSRCLCDGQY